MAVPPTPQPDPPYRLVIFDEVDDTAAVRDLFCRVTGLHPTDVNQWIGRAPLIVRHPLSAAEVKKLLDGLYDLGVAAEAWRADALPNLYPARILHDLAFQPGGFQVKGLRGEPAHWVPWNKVELLAAGEIEQADEIRDVKPAGWVQAVSTGLNAMMRRPQAVARRNRTMRVERDPVGELIIVRKDPRIALRIVESQMKYNCLGDRIQPSASQNFPVLIEALRAQADDADVTPSTHALLAQEDPGAYQFATSQALLDYTTIRLLWAWYRRDRAQSDDVRDRPQRDDTEEIPGADA